MNWSKRTLFIAALTICIALGASGCGTVQKIPIKLDPNFVHKGIDTIMLMPVVDRRVDKSAKLDFEKGIRLPAKKILEKKGYTVIMPDTYLEGSNITADQVAEMNVDDLSGLGPKDSRALVFIYVEDVLDSYVVLAYTFKIEATGSLIYKEEKSELWRDKGIGAYGQGGLISGITSGLDKSVAVSQCLENIFVSLPKCTVKANNIEKTAVERPVSGTSQGTPLMGVSKSAL